MTILMAFRAPSLEIIGLTTIFGNVDTEGATRNALLLVSIWDGWALFIYFLGIAWVKFIEKHDGGDWKVPLDIVQYQVSTS